MQEAIVAPSPSPATSLVCAGFWLRAGAQIIDLLLHNVIWFFSSAATGVAVGLYLGLSGQPLEPVSAKLAETTLLSTVFALLGYILYHTIFEGAHGATVGKILCGLHVLGQDGQPAGAWAALIRSAAFYIDSVFFGLIAWSRMKQSPLQQRYGDKWAKTVVVQRSKVIQARWPSGWMFVLALILATGVDSLLCVLALLLKLI